MRVWASFLESCYLLLVPEAPRFIEVSFAAVSMYVT